MPIPDPADDPRPLEPVRPDIDDCCRSGCDPCVFDLYDEALERYQRALQAWQQRQAARAAQADSERAGARPASDRKS